MTVFRGAVVYPTSAYTRCACSKLTRAHTGRCGRCKAWHTFWGRVQVRERRLRVA